MNPPQITDEELAQETVARLRGEPAIADAWQSYSHDKRTTPSPYLDGPEVGYFDGERRDVTKYDDALDACADFIVRETRWMLRDR